MLWLATSMTAYAEPGSDEPLALTTLASFDGTHGANPRAALVQGSDGNFYGTTGAGGTGSIGTVFKVTPAGKLTMLYAFSGNDGNEPLAALVQGSDGKFYGTTYGGGANGDYGTIFKITKTGHLTTIYSFCGVRNCADGQYPLGALVPAANGYFYGTTTAGGNTSCDLQFGCGTVFKVSKSGKLTTIYDFCSNSGCTDGAAPTGMVQGADGNFYGTTGKGGTAGNCGSSGCGTVFKITPSGKVTTLHTFCTENNCPDGAQPETGLLLGADHNFYGTTMFGGSNNTGTVFRITRTGKLTTLYSLCSQTGCPGAYPNGLAQGTDGNLYATTQNGGDNRGGTLFELTTKGKETTLYSFCAQSGCTDGSRPFAAVVQGTDGSFYGTTAFGGTVNNDGTVFKFSKHGSDLASGGSRKSQRNWVRGRQPWIPITQRK